MRSAIRQLTRAGALVLLLVTATVTGPGPVSASPGTGPAREGTTALVQPAGEPVLSVRGIGPYRIGVKLDKLVAAGLVTEAWPTPGCPDVVGTGTTGEWAGTFLLVFRGGRLVEVGTATVPPRSPAGAAVGMSFAELEDIYGDRGEMIYSSGGAPGYLVRAGSRVELFTGHPIRPGVGYFQVGPANFVERAFRQGATC